MERFIQFLIVKKNALLITLLVSITLGVAFYRWADSHHTAVRMQKVIAVTKFQKEFTQHIDFENGKWPRVLEYGQHKFKLSYTFNDELKLYVRRLLRRFFTKNTSVVVINNDTGEILLALDYTFKGRHFGSGITFSSTHPAASLFKIVSLAAILNSGKTTLNDRYRCRGRGTTLYRYQLDPKKRSWDRQLTLKSAFAFSNNVVIARAAQRNINRIELSSMAQRFMFNQNIYEHLMLSSSFFVTPEDDYNLAEKASGFNRETLISPVHGALLSMIIAREGNFIPLTVLKKIEEQGVDKTKQYSRRQSRQVVRPEIAQKVGQAMQLVVSKGTARRYLRSTLKKFKDYLELGGKTGRISGGFPEGMRDWFSAYAKPKGSRGISVCVMNVNGRNWYVKASYIAKKIIEYYYSNIVPIKKISKQELVHNQVLDKGES